MIRIFVGREATFIEAAIHGSWGGGVWYSAYLAVFMKPDASPIEAEIAFDAENRCIAMLLEASVEISGVACRYADTLAILRCRKRAVKYSAHDA